MQVDRCTKGRRRTLAADSRSSDVARQVRVAGPGAGAGAGAGAGLLMNFLGSERVAFGIDFGLACPSRKGFLGGGVSSESESLRKRTRFFAAEGHRKHRTLK